MAHVSKQAMERFLRGETSRRQNRQIVRHLLRCEPCGSLASSVWRPGGSRNYEEVIARLCRRSVAEHDRAMERLGAARGFVAGTADARNNSDAMQSRRQVEKR
jgi:hypothetical protein